MPRLLFAAFAFATCLVACGPSTSTGSAPAPISASRAGTSWMATLIPVGTSTVRGTAMVHGMNDRQTAQVQITGGSPSALYPWHIHSGTCADGMTPIVGSPRLYTALGTSTDGSASLTADLPVTIDASQRYHVNVHASPTDMGTIVACGDLSAHDM